jgi:catechol 2,3-dioxygenase-like lactoylglutathione lyase family enzyme
MMKVFFILLGIVMSLGQVNSAGSISVDAFLEVALPAEDMQKSKSFYTSLGYELINEQPWGMATLIRGNDRLTLLSKKFFLKPALAFTTKDIAALMKELQANSVEILEDDSQSVPARVVINDPSGNEIIIYEAK